MASFFFLILGDLILTGCPPIVHSTYISHVSVAHTQNVLHVIIPPTLCVLIPVYPPGCVLCTRTMHLTCRVHATLAVRLVQALPHLCPGVDFCLYCCLPSPARPGGGHWGHRSLAPSSLQLKLFCPEKVRCPVRADRREAQGLRGSMVTGKAFGAGSGAAVVVPLSCLISPPALLGGSEGLGLRRTQPLDSRDRCQLLPTAAAPAACL